MANDSKKYRRQVRTNGTSVFVRKKSILAIGRNEKQRALCGDVLLVNLSEEFRRASRHELPLQFRVALAADDAALDRAYERLQGLSRKQLEEVLAGLMIRILQDHRDRLPDFTARQLLTFLDRQFNALGLEVLEVHQPA